MSRARTPIPQLRTAEHLTAASNADQCPDLNLPEVAFAGRSNVGKSSLLNMLLGRKGIARVSSTPGRTQLLHFYLVNEALSVVDLPGFGYARVSRSMRASWKNLVEGYLRRRRDLRAVVLIVDIRRGLEDEELGLIEWLQQEDVGAIVVATKCDKISKSQVFGRLQKIRKSLPSSVDAPVGFSAHSGVGRAELWRRVCGLLTSEELARLRGEDGLGGASE